MRAVAETSIEWTDRTWNPVSGCTRVSDGCDLCYAVAMTRRLAGHANTRAKYAGLVNQGKSHFNGVVRTDESVLDEPLRRRQPSRWFVNSMSDLFHDGVPEAFIARVFDVMRRAHWHAFQVLTKRPERAAALAGSLPWPPNVLLGTSVEDHRVLHRIDALRSVPAAVRFLSCEPLIGPLGSVDLRGIHWVIAGGESGPSRRVRPMDIDWVRDIRAQAQSAGVAFHFKQYGKLTNNPDAVDPTAKENGGKAKGGRTLDGRTWDEHPAVAGYRDHEGADLFEADSRSHVRRPVGVPAGLATGA